MGHYRPRLRCRDRRRSRDPFSATTTKFMLSLCSRRMDAVHVTASDDYDRANMANIRNNRGACRAGASNYPTEKLSSDERQRFFLVAH